MLQRPVERQLLATVDELDGGLLEVSIEGKTVWALLCAYGAAGERIDAVGEAWRGWLSGIFGLPAG